MKNLSKILALMLALFMMMPIVIGAAGNPDDVPGALQYPDTNYYVGASGHNYFSILPGHSATKGAGFGTSNPLGLAKVGGLWPSVKTLPVFELLAYDRTSGAFNPGNLVALTPDGKHYQLPDGGHGFSYSQTGTTKQGAWESFYAEPGEKYSPVVSFTAPFDGKYEWRISIQRENNTLSGNADKPYSDRTGMQLKYYKNNSLIYREVINDNSQRTISVQEQLKKGDVFYLEFDPKENNIKDDEFYVRDLKVYCLSPYDGERDAEYDNSGKTPLMSLALISDIHADMDQVVDDIPTYENYPKMLDMIRERGDIDAILLGGDLLSDNYYYGNKPLFKNSCWTNERIEKTNNFIFSEAHKATQDGKGIVVGVAGNHDKDAGTVAAHDKVTNKCGEIEEIHSGDYYKYFATEKMSGAAMKTLRFNDMGEGFYSPYNEVICYRYNVLGLEIIGISQSRSTIENTPYPNYGCKENGLDDDYGSNGQHQNSERIWKEQAEWVVGQLEEIGPDKTVVVLCHYNMNASAMKTDGAANILLNAFDNYPNLFYVYGHQHGSNDRSETWYNTIEHVETLGNRVQLNDGSYATDSWQYIYMGSVRYGTNASSTNFNTPVSQFLTMDIYNDHITFQTHNAGSEYPVSGFEVPSSYTVTREMSQIDGYTGDGSGNIEVPEAPVDGAALQHIPIEVTNVKKRYVMDLGINNLESGPFAVKGIFELTNAKISLSDKAVPTSWSDKYLMHTYDGKALVQTSQRKGMFDMRAAVGYSSAMVFTAPEAGAYKYEVDMNKVTSGGGECQIKVMKGGSVLLTSYTPENKSGAQVSLSGYVYLEKGEDVRVIVAKSVNSSSVSANEFAVNSFVIKQYDGYTLPEVGSGGSGNTSVGVCPHKGGEANCCERAICELCGAAYGPLNPGKHRDSKPEETITDVRHKSVYACCGRIVIGDGYHAFANGKCLICEFECDHDGYIVDGKCENCKFAEIPESNDAEVKEEKDGLPEIVIYVIIAVVVIALGVTVTLLITKRSLKKK